MDRHRTIFSRQMLRLQRLASGYIYLFILILCWINFDLHHSAHAGTTPASHTIVILASSNSKLYQGVIDTVITTAIENDETNIIFKTIYSKQKYELKERIAEIDNIDLLVTIGQQAPRLGAALDQPPPILATLIPRQAYQDIYSDFLQRHPAISPQISAIYLDNPISRQLYLTRVLLGGSRRIGILIYDDAPIIEKDINTMARQAGIKISIERINKDKNIIHSLASVLERSSALIAIPDMRIFNRRNAKNILLTLYRHRAPLIAFSASYVKAGALASVYTTPQQPAKQTANTILQILANGATLPRQPAYPNEFEVATNENVAKSLGISLKSDDEIKRAILLREAHN